MITTIRCGCQFLIDSDLLDLISIDFVYTKTFFGIELYQTLRSIDKQQQQQSNLIKSFSEQCRMWHNGELLLIELFLGETKIGKYQ